MGRKKEKTDEEILAAARSCFIEYGPAVATGVIARELGVSQATLFNRFNTKRELMFAALGPPERSRLHEILSSRPDDRSIQKQLVEIGQAAIEYFNDTDPRLAVLRAAGATGDQISQRYSVLPKDLSRTAFSRWILLAREDQRISEIDADSFSLAFMGALKSVSAEDVPSLSSDDSSDATSDAKPSSQALSVNAVVDIFWRAIDPARS